MAATQENPGSSPRAEVLIGYPAGWCLSPRRANADILGQTGTQTGA